MMTSKYVITNTRFCALVLILFDLYYAKSIRTNRHAEAIPLYLRWISLYVICLLFSQPIDTVTKCVCTYDRSQVNVFLALPCSLQWC